MTTPYKFWKAIRTLAVVYKLPSLVLERVAWYIIVPNVQVKAEVLQFALIEVSLDLIA